MARPRKSGRRTTQDTGALLRNRAGGLKPRTLFHGFGLSALIPCAALMLSACHNPANDEVSPSTYWNIADYLELKSPDDPRRILMRKLLADNKLTYAEMEQFDELSNRIERAEGMAAVNGVKDALRGGANG